MFLYLSQTGDSAFIPDGAAVIDYGESEVAVVDEKGKLIAVFRRKDLVAYSMFPLPEPTVVEPIAW